MAIVRMSVALHQNKKNLCKGHGKQAPARPTCVKKKTDQTDEVALWHQRLGSTFSVRIVSQHVSDRLLPHASCSKTECETCAKGKFREKFSGSLTNARAVGKLH